MKLNTYINHFLLRRILSRCSSLYVIYPMRFCNGDYGEKAKSYLKIITVRRVKIALDNRIWFYINLAWIRQDWPETLLARDFAGQRLYRMAHHLYDSRWRVLLHPIQDGLGRVCDILPCGCPKVFPNYHGITVPWYMVKAKLFIIETKTQTNQFANFQEKFFDISWYIQCSSYIRTSKGNLKSVILI